MIEIALQVAGDHWINPDQVRQQLAQYGSSEITIDLGAEGPSLNALGITDMLLRHCRDNAIDHRDVKIRAWSNPVESVPFARAENKAMRLSHFFWMCRDYWCDIVTSDHSYRLGMFMGRRTFARCGIMHDVLTAWPHRALTSCMRGGQDLDWTNHMGRNLESWPDWIRDRESFMTWWRHHAPCSIDGHSVADQYSSDHNTNRDLLKSYDKFDVELVCETYTLGDTFFPTEKTVRPIMCGKPLVVYGPRYFLKRLRELGFQTWHDFWSEDYDNCQGPQRWRLMRDTINSIMSTQDWRTISLDLEKISQHNRQILEKLIRDYAPR